MHEYQGEKRRKGGKIVQALEQILPCSQQKCLQSHRFILKELQPMRRTLAGREENCEEEGAAESRHEGLTNSPFPCVACRVVVEKVQDSRVKLGIG